MRPGSHALAEASVVEVTAESHQMLPALAHSREACSTRGCVSPCPWLSYREGRTDLHCSPSPKRMAIFTSRGTSSLQDLPPALLSQPLGIVADNVA